MVGDRVKVVLLMGIDERVERMRLDLGSGRDRGHGNGSKSIYCRMKS